MTLKEQNTRRLQDFRQAHKPSDLPPTTPGSARLFWLVCLTVSSGTFWAATSFFHWAKAQFLGG